MKAMLLAGLCCLISFSANAAHDFMTSKELLAFYDKTNERGRDIVETLLMFTSIGLGYANATLIVERKEQPLYCPPGKLGLTGSQLVEILRQGVMKDPSYADERPPLTLFEALRYTFPCPSK